MRDGVLSRPAFRLLLSGQGISALGDRLVPVALAFAVLDLTGSVTDLGIVLAAQTLPLVVFVLLGGVWADRLPRQRVMLASDAVRALAQGLSALLLLEHSAHVWQLVALQAVYGTAEAFFGPASTALVPETVPPEALQQANALLGLTGNVASVAGPALAGVIVATAGSGWGLAVDAATFVVSAVFLSLMPREPRAAATTQPPATLATATSTIAELRAGWREFVSHTWLWVTVAFFTIWTAVVFAPVLVLGPQVARTALGGAAAWAAISTAVGIGSVAGGLLGLRWHPRHPLRIAFLAMLVAGPAYCALLAAHAPLPLILVFALARGWFVTLFNVFWLTALQQEVALSELSRVSSWDYLGSLAIQPVGVALTGSVAAAIGVSTTLYGAAGMFVLLLVCVLAVPSVRNFTSAAPAPISEEKEIIPESVSPQSRVGM